MSVVIVPDGSAGNSPHDQDTGSATAPWIVKLHAASGVCGVGPADSTGRPLVTYWPGGTPEGSLMARRRPRNQREIGLISALSSRASGRATGE